MGNIDGIIGIGFLAMVLIMILAVILIGAVEHDRVIEERQNVYFQTIRALVVAIEEKDPYTKMHSHNVASFASSIAKEMGLDSEKTQRIYIAGLLHDIGKIAVPELIINKPAKLTEAEYNLVKLHPGNGVRIVQNVAFSNNIIGAVCQHHERWDGEGYQAGLAGEEIILFARILAVADTIDAMTSERSYRSARHIHDVLDELDRESGFQFDPEIVVVAKRLLVDGTLSKRSLA